MPIKIEGWHQPDGPGPGWEVFFIINEEGRWQREFKTREQAKQYLTNIYHETRRV
jgi:hypothetical protein